MLMSRGRVPGEGGLDIEVGMLFPPQSRGSTEGKEVSSVSKVSRVDVSLPLEGKK